MLGLRHKTCVVSLTKDFYEGLGLVDSVRQPKSTK